MTTPGTGPPRIPGPFISYRRRRCTPAAKSVSLKRSRNRLEETSRNNWCNPNTLPHGFTRTRIFFRKKPCINPCKSVLNRLQGLRTCDKRNCKSPEGKVFIRHPNQCMGTIWKIKCSFHLGKREMSSLKLLKVNTTCCTVPGKNTVQLCLRYAFLLEMN